MNAPGQLNTGLQDVQCWQCGEMGHVIRNCPKGPWGGQYGPQTLRTSRNRPNRPMESRITRNWTINSLPGYGETKVGPGEGPLRIGISRLRARGGADAVVFYTASTM